MFKESKAMRQEKSNETLISVVESWATTDNPFNSIDEILAWVRKKIAATKVSVRKRHYLYDGREWFYDQAKGEIRHKSGHFFQIKGLKLFADDTLIHEQPIIVQFPSSHLRNTVTERGFFRRPDVTGCGFLTCTPAGILSSPEVT